MELCPREAHLTSAPLLAGAIGGLEKIFASSAELREGIHANRHDVPHLAVRAPRPVVVLRPAFSPPRSGKRPFDYQWWRRRLWVDARVLPASPSSARDGSREMSAAKPSPRRDRAWHGSPRPLQEQVALLADHRARGLLPSPPLHRSPSAAARGSCVHDAREDGLVQPARRCPDKDHDGLVGPAWHHADAPGL